MAKIGIINRNPGDLLAQGFACVIVLGFLYGSYTYFWVGEGNFGMWLGGAIATLFGCLWLLKEYEDPLYNWALCGVISGWLIGVLVMLLSGFASGNAVAVI